MIAATRCIIEAHDRHHCGAMVDQRTNSPARGRASAPVRWRDAGRIHSHCSGAAISGRAKGDANVCWVGIDEGILLTTFAAPELSALGISTEQPAM